MRGAESARLAFHCQFLDDVSRIHAGHHRRYGSPRVPGCSSPGPLLKTPAPPWADRSWRRDPRPALHHRLGIGADACVKGRRSMIHKLLLPAVNLVRMDLAAVRQLSHRRLIASNLQGDLRLPRQVDLASRLLSHRSLRYPTEKPISNLAHGPKNRVHFTRKRGEQLNGESMRKLTANDPLMRAGTPASIAAVGQASHSPRSRGIAAHHSVKSVPTIREMRRPGAVDLLTRTQGRRSGLTCSRHNVQTREGVGRKLPLAFRMNLREASARKAICQNALSGWTSRMKTITLIILLQLTVPARSENGSTKDLLAACSSTPDSIGDLICGAYINGLANGIMDSKISRDNGHPICIPDGTTSNQLRHSIKTYIISRPPDTMEVSYIGAVLSALEAIYPCHNPN